MRQIPDQVVHRLCSGQVITHVTDAVKELVDNAIDSGAKSVRIVLTEAGLAAIEVIDDGTGIREPDFDQLCLKYTTSKLEQMEDLMQMRSLGFRGEALSSLCSVSALVRVVTKSVDADFGHNLEFDHTGQVTKKMAHPRPTGTTVTVKGLFEKVPVRRKCLQKEKPQSIVNKITNLIRDYGMALPHIHFILSENDRMAQKRDLLNLSATPNLRQRVSVVLKPIPEFVRLVAVTDILPEIAAEFSVTEKEAELVRDIGVDGVISKSGSGRSGSDWQFFSVNGRPVEFPKLAKIINQTFRAYDPTASGQRYPFFAINMTMPFETVDVNVTPNKRTVLVPHENAVWALIKSSIVQLFGQDPVSLKQAKYSESCSQVTIIAADETIAPQTHRMRDVSINSAQESPIPDPSNKRITDFFEPTPRPSDAWPTAAITGATAGAPVTHLLSDQSAAPFPEPDIVIRNPLQSVNQADSCSRMPVFQTARTFLNTMPRMLTDYDNEREVRDRRSRSGSADSGGEHSGNWRNRRTSMSPGLEISGYGPQRNKRMRCSTPTRGNSPPTFRVPDVSQIPQRTRARSEGDSAPIPSPAQSAPIEMVPIPDRPSVRIQIDLDEIRADVCSSDGNATECGPRFSMDVDSAVSEEEAIGEMQRLLQKEDFRKMQIIGQFNRSFIVTQLGTDVLIVDQHASDERRNFDELLSHSDLEPQKLIRPEKLQMTPYQEITLRTFQNRFEKNGFRFAFDEGADPGNRLSLTAVPSSCDKLLSSADVFELLEDIQSLTSASVPACIRPTKVKEMLAMRACKKSIRMNDPLTMDQMRKVIDRMSETSAPWTCAHGRPTVRFLSRIGQEKGLAAVPEVSSQTENSSQDQ